MLLKRCIHRVIIKATIQQVWDALTKEGEVLPFFFGSVMHTTGLKPGAQLRMRTPNGKYTGVVPACGWDHCPAADLPTDFKSMTVESISLLLNHAVFAPKRKRGKHGKTPLAMWVVRVWEPHPPEGVEPLEWILWTNQECVNFESAQCVKTWHESHAPRCHFHRRETTLRVDATEFRMDKSYLDIASRSCP